MYLEMSTDTINQVPEEATKHTPQSTTIELAIRLEIKFQAALTRRGAKEKVESGTAMGAGRCGMRRIIISAAQLSQINHWNVQEVMNLWFAEEVVGRRLILVQVSEFNVEVGEV